jgi:hypothetical protein
MAFSFKSSHQPYDASDLWPINYGEYGRCVAMSSDGTQVAVASMVDGESSRVYILEKVGGVWTSKGSVQLPDIEIWKDTFDGATNQDKLISLTPTGTVTESGGNLTISVPAAASIWGNNPIAWRFENHRVPQQCTVATITSATAIADFACGVASIDRGKHGTAAQNYGFILELYYDGAFKVQCRKVVAGVISNLGSPLTVTDPSSSPLTLKLQVDYYDGFILGFARSGSGSWQRIVYDDSAFGWGGETVAQCLYARNYNTYPAGSAVFSEAYSYLVPAYCRPHYNNSLSIEDDTLVVTYYNGFWDLGESSDISPPFPASGMEFGYNIHLTREYHGPDDRHAALLFIGAPGESSGQGAVYAYRRIDGEWNNVLKFTASDGAAGDRFGSYITSYNMGVDYDAETIFISAPNASSGNGKVYVFTRNSYLAYSESQILTSYAPVVNGAFGTSLCAASSTELYIGEPAGNSNKGGVQKFTKSGTYSYTATLTDSSGASGDQFGFSIFRLYYGSNLWVGSPGYLSGKGAVHRFVSDVYSARFTDPGGSSGDSFGYTILQGYNKLLVGAPSKNGKGSVILFKYYSSTWSYDRDLSPPFLATGDRFGISLSAYIDGFQGVVGADGSGSLVGYLTTLENSGDFERGISIRSNISPGDVSGSDYFGGAVFASARYFIGGRKGDSIGGVSCGSVYTVPHNRITDGSDYGESLTVIWKKSSGTWNTVPDQYIYAPDPLKNSTWSRHAGLSSDKTTLVTDDDQTGVARIYKLVGGKYQFLQSFAGIWSEYGSCSVSNDGSLIILGDTYIPNGAYSGGFHVLKEAGGVYSELPPVFPHNLYYSYVGWLVSASRSCKWVAMPQQTGNEVEIFKYNGTGYDYETTVVPPWATDKYTFVSIQDTVNDEKPILAVVPRYKVDTNYRIYIYKKDGTWSSVQNIFPDPLLYYYAYAPAMSDKGGVLALPDAYGPDPWDLTVHGIVLFYETPTDTDPPYLANQNPSPSAIGVSPNSNVNLDVLDSDSGVNESTVIITVSGNIAYQSSSEQTGFFVTVTSQTLGYRYSINPWYPFVYGSHMSVRVQAEDNMGNALDATYYFDVAILVPALISESVFGIDKASHLGRERFFVYGHALTDTLSDDKFSALSLDSILWNDVSSGTGVINPGISGLLCDTGLTTTSIAGVEGKLTHSGDFDFRLSYKTLSNFDEAPLYFGPEDYVDLASLEVVCGSRRVCVHHIYSELKGQAWCEVDSFQSFSYVSEFENTLRILRTGRRITMFFNDQMVLDWMDWVTGDVTTNLLVSNGSSSYRISTIFKEFKRETTVSFGEELSLDIDSRTKNRLFGTFPSLRIDGNTWIDMKVTNYGGEAIVEDEVQYMIPDKFTVMNSSGSKIESIDDKTIRNLDTNSPGFEKGGIR